MKRKYTLIDNINHKNISSEVEIPDKDHLQAQIKYPATTVKPRKGKGSYTRKQKYKSIPEC